VKRILIVVSILFSSSVNADVSAEQKLEIDHLLNFVINSSCKINRNGKIHEGSKATSHIQKKYEYFKDDIKTTEQFIELSATKSTMSGNYYIVICGDNKPFKTKVWLLKELKSYRESGNT
jgi:hypothetical protein